jgi:hypothetical protein
VQPVRLIRLGTHLKSDLGVTLRYLYYCQPEYQSPPKGKGRHMSHSMYHCPSYDNILVVISDHLMEQLSPIQAGNVMNNYVRYAKGLLVIRAEGREQLLNMS